MDSRQLELKTINGGPISIPNDPVAIRENKASITSMQFEPCGNHLAVATFDGHVKFYSPNTGRMSATLNSRQTHGTEEKLTFTCVRWKPEWDGAVAKPSQWVTVLSSSGQIIKYNMGSKKNIDLVVDKS